MDFAVDNELNAIAIASSQTVYLFDTEGFTFMNKIEVENIERVVFC